MTTDAQIDALLVINLVHMQQADSDEPAGCRASDLQRLLGWAPRRQGGVVASLVRRRWIVRVDNSDAPGYGLTAAGVEQLDAVRDRTAGRLGGPPAPPERP